MEINELVYKRFTCLRKKVGEVIVQDKRILATGYNDAHKVLPHCLEIGCLREIKKIIYREKYLNKLARKILKEAGAVEIYYE